MTRLDLRRLWPDPAPLDDAGLRAAYEPDRARPGVRANFVTSLDGAVEVDGYSRGLSNEADQQLLRTLRGLTDAVMVGAGTLRQEGYGALRLGATNRAWRRDHGLPEHPTLVIVSGSLSLDARDRVFTEAPVRPVVLTHAGAPRERRTPVESVADVVTCGESLVDLAVGLATLRERGLAQILCEGGPHLLGALIAADLLDELCLTISPLLAGAGASRIVAGGRRDVPADMRVVHLIAAGDTLLTRYARAR